MRNKTKITYDPDADVLSMEVSGKAKIDHASEVGNFIVHVSKSGQPVLVEMLNAGATLKSSNQAVNKGMLTGRTVSAFVS